MRSLQVYTRECSIILHISTEYWNEARADIDVTDESERVVGSWEEISGGWPESSEQDISCDRSRCSTIVSLGREKSVQRRYDKNRFGREKTRRERELFA